jgi:hypothetical protein
MPRSILLAIAACSALLPAASGQVLNAKLRSGQATISAVCVMPVEATWTKVIVMSREPRPEEADRWSEQLGPVVREGILKAGAQDTSAPIAENARRVILQLQQKFDAMKVEGWHADGIKRGRFSLGDEVALVPCAAHADALLFVRGKASIPAVARFASASLQLTFVDARSGEVLAQDTISTLNDTFLKTPREAYLDILVKRFHAMRVGFRRVPG